MGYNRGEIPYDTKSSPDHSSSTRRQPRSQSNPASTGAQQVLWRPNDVEAFFLDALQGL